MYKVFPLTKVLEIILGGLGRPYLIRCCAHDVDSIARTQPTFGKSVPRTTIVQAGPEGVT